MIDTTFMTSAQRILASEHIFTIVDSIAANTGFYDTKQNSLG